jgi:hypothetical protein
VEGDELLEVVHTGNLLLILFPSDEPAGPPRRSSRAAPSTQSRPAPASSRSGASRARPPTSAQRWRADQGGRGAPRPGSGSAGSRRVRCEMSHPVRLVTRGHDAVGP